MVVLYMRYMYYVNDFFFVRVFRGVTNSVLGSVTDIYDL